MKDNSLLPKTGQLMLPEPTSENPLVQLDFLFGRLGKIKQSNSKTIKNVLSFYKRVYLANTDNYDLVLSKNKLFYIHEQWDDFALLKLQTFLGGYNVDSNPNRISSSWTVAIVTTVRQVMEYAVLNKFSSAKHVNVTACAPISKETTQNTAFSDNELGQIEDWLKKELNHAEKIIQASGYQLLGVGRDPRKLSAEEGLIEEEQYTKVGWNSVENLHWYFENVMNCQAHCKPVYYTQPHYWFYHYAVKYFGSYDNLLDSWQIKSIVSLNVIMPLALKLAMETGLNPTSIWDLTVDCFQERHPLSGAPYIKYYKARSQGNMEMHLSPYDKNVSIQEYKQGQANVVRRTIETIIKVTELLRKRAPAEFRRYLFIYERLPRKGNFEGKKPTNLISSINVYVASQWCCSCVVANNLTADDGKPLQLTVGRFRSTKITDMVRNGIDFFEIQSHCGHKSITTTFKYLARNKLDIVARRDIHRVIKNIHENRAWQESAQPVYACGSESVTGAVIYKGIVSDCKNVFDPPDEVKKLKSYQPGQACSRYNMCLFCKNVLLTKYHLPSLLIYQRQIQQAVGYANVELPNEQYYQKTKAVLDYILNPDKSEFSREDIAWATSVAEGTDEFIDPVVYRPIL